MSTSLLFILATARKPAEGSREQQPVMQVLPVLNLHTTLALLIAVFALNLFGA